MVIHLKCYCMELPPEKSDFEIELSGEEASIREVLDKASEMDGFDIKDDVIAESVISLNNNLVPLDTIVKDGDKVYLLHPLSGG